MIQKAKELLKYNFIPISCNIKKIPIKKNWNNVTKDDCLQHIKDNYNIGILTGKISNIIIFDIDVKDNGLNAWNELLKTY